MDGQPWHHLLVVLVGKFVLMIVPALTLLRIYSIARGLVWLWRNGARFNDLLAARQPITIDERDEIIRLTGGSFLPFGSKAYRLARAARNGRTRWQRALRSPLRPLLLAWRYPVFVLLLLAYLIMLAHAPWIESPDLRGFASVGGVVTALLAMIGPILLAVEALVAMAFTGAYATSVHAGSLREDAMKPKILIEFQAFVGALFTAHVSAAGAMYLVSTRIEEYGKLPVPPESLLAAIQRVQDVSYYSLFTMLGASDPEPQGPIGKLATGLIGLQGIALLLIVLGTTMSPPARHASAAAPPEEGVTPDPPASRTADTEPARPGPKGDRRRSRLAVVAAAAAVVAVTAMVTRHSGSRRSQRR
ncbi:hypothetical protein [Micromonospora sp. RTGN7]|uniref:hypothetical protein n=1 Tax=Micromonospora sp. RTGN7 TaxID=3016526 RepID=UPI0029FF381E|nr:hypothetical protein [Micromonospora sp. RTGN7]